MNGRDVVASPWVPVAEPRRDEPGRFAGPVLVALLAARGLPPGRFQRPSPARGLRARRIAEGSSGRGPIPAGLH